MIEPQPGEYWMDHTGGVYYIERFDVFAGRDVLVVVSSHGSEFLYGRDGKCSDLEPELDLISRVFQSMFGRV